MGALSYRAAKTAALGIVAIAVLAIGVATPALAEASAINPAAHSYLRGIGKAGTFGWPSSEKIEALRLAFLSAQDDQERKRLARDIQTQAMQDTPYLPLGYYAQPAAYSQKLSGIHLGFSQFYGVKKA